MSRRLTQSLLVFLNNQNLTDKEQRFIVRCTKLQRIHPQLTTKQWVVIIEIKDKYEKEQLMNNILKEFNDWTAASTWLAKHGYGLEQIANLKEEWEAFSKKEDKKEDKIDSITPVKKVITTSEIKK